MYCPNPECPDFKETGVPGEYVEGVAVCPFCGSGLVVQMPDMNPLQDENEPEEDEDDVDTIDDLDEELVVIATYNSRPDAELVTAYLLDHGIDVFESPDDWSGTDAPPDSATKTRLLAPESQAERAIALVKKAEKDL